MAKKAATPPKDEIEELDNNETLEVEIGDDDFPTPPAGGDAAGEEEDDDAPPAGEGDEEEDDDGKDPVVKDLERQLEERSAALEDANERARKAEEGRQGPSKKEQAVTYLAGKETEHGKNIETLDAKLAAAKSKRKEARAEGDEDAIDEADDEVKRLQVKRDREEDLKTAAGDAKKKWEAAPDEEPAARTPPADDMPETTKNWIKAHPRFQLDAEGNPENDYSAEAIAAHNIAVRKNLKPGSQKYIDFIDARMLREYPDHEVPGSKKRNDGDPPPSADKPKTSKKQATAAPGSSDGGGGQRQQGGNRKVHLSKTEHKEYSDAAKMSDMTLEEYLKTPEMKQKLANR